MSFTRLTLPLVGLLAAGALLIPGSALADSSSTLTVVGTSDVSDSGLIQNVIEPEFEAAYPQFTFKYVGSATGTAIQNAETGNGGPSALIVHAASLENQFVSNGYSYPTGAYGNAIFTNDFVLVGPTGATGTTDPAGILPSGAPHNIAQAMADIANKGAAGKATFVSRGGGATASGTTVEEHALWALMNNSSPSLTPPGVDVCNVSAADGGGMSPISAAAFATLDSNHDCPDGGTVLQPEAPSWYQINANSTQGQNMLATNACTIGTSGPNTCYTLSDRGTFDYLASGIDPAGSIPNLQIVTDDNSASAPGGQFELTNYFHVYIINPTKTGESVNLPAAQDFVSFLTSPAFQSQLASYLNVFTYSQPATSNPLGAPFVADASPTITATGIPATDAGGAPVTVSGTVTNNEHGYPAVSAQTVTLDELVAGVPIPVKTATTGTTGGYSITFDPTSSGSYQVTTGNISMIENPSLSPAYGDILSPGASAVSKMTVSGAALVTAVKGVAGGVTVAGVVGPAAPDTSATVNVMARPQSSSGAFANVGGASLAAGQSTFAANGTLSPGKYTVEVTYTDPGQFTAGTSTTANVTVPASTTSASIKKVKVKKGKLTVTGSLSQAAGASGATVSLYALSTGKLGKTHAIRIELVRAHAAARFSRVAQTKVKAGATKFTIKGKLPRGHSYALQLQVSQSGQPTAYSKVSPIKVP